MDPSEPSESIFVHRSQIASIGHICSEPRWYLAENGAIASGHSFLPYTLA